MNDYINKVHKIIYDDKTGTIAFILQTDGDQDFWYWQVSKYDIHDYFRNKGDNFGMVRAYSGRLTKAQAEEICNSLELSDKGVSGANFETIEDALKDLGIL
jgi:hypothetical protein